MEGIENEGKVVIEGKARVPRYPQPCFSPPKDFRQTGNYYKNVYNISCFAEYGKNQLTSHTEDTPPVAPNNKNVGMSTGELTPT